MGEAALEAVGYWCGAVLGVAVVSEVALIAGVYTSALINVLDPKTRDAYRMQLTLRNRCDEFPKYTSPVFFGGPNGDMQFKALRVPAVGTKGVFKGGNCFTMWSANNQVAVQNFGETQSVKECNDRQAVWAKDRTSKTIAPPKFSPLVQCIEYNDELKITVTPF